MFKSGDITGKIIGQLPGGLVEVDYYGTTMVLPESENEFSSNDAFSRGGEPSHSNKHIMEHNPKAADGMLVGNSHAEGGIKIQTPEGQIEAEGGETIINKRSMASNEILVCEGTPKQIASKVNEFGDGVQFDTGGTCKIVSKGENVSASSTEESKHTAANGKMISDFEDGVYLDELSGLHKFVLVDSRTNQRLSTEYFTSEDQARQFAHDNELHFLEGFVPNRMSEDRAARGKKIGEQRIYLNSKMSSEFEIPYNNDRPRAILTAIHTDALKETYKQVYGDIPEEYRELLEKPRDLRLIGDGFGWWKVEEVDYAVGGPVSELTARGKKYTIASIQEPSITWQADEDDLKRYIAEERDELAIRLDESRDSALNKMGLRVWENIPITIHEDQGDREGGNETASRGTVVRSHDASVRPSPSVSATIFPAGHHMTGNDGNTWEIREDSRGVHRWVKLKYEDGGGIAQVGTVVQKDNVMMERNDTIDEYTQYWIWFLDMFAVYGDVTFNLNFEYEEFTDSTDQWDYRTESHFTEESTGTHKVVSGYEYLGVVNDSSQIVDVPDYVEDELKDELKKLYEIHFEGKSEEDLYNGRIMGNSKFADGGPISEFQQSVAQALEKLMAYVVSKDNKLTIHGSEYTFVSKSPLYIRVTGGRGATYNITPFFPKGTTGIYHGASYFTLVRAGKKEPFALLENGTLADVAADGIAIPGQGGVPSIGEAKSYLKMQQEATPMGRMKNMVSFAKDHPQMLLEDGGDVTKMSIIARIVTKPLEMTSEPSGEKSTIPAAEYDVVEIIEQGGKKIYVTNLWYKEYKKIPLIIIEDLVESVEVKTGGHLVRPDGRINSYEKDRNEQLTKAGFDVSALTDEQKNVILEPSEAPENYYMDGEINARDAQKYWLLRLALSGLTTDQIRKAKKMFASDGAEIEAAHGMELPSESDAKRQWNDWTYEQKMEFLELNLPYSELTPEQFNAKFGHSRGTLAHYFANLSWEDPAFADVRKTVINYVSQKNFDGLRKKFPFLEMADGGMLEAGTKWSYEIKVFKDDKWYGVSATWDTKEDAEKAGNTKYNNWMNAEDYRVVEVK